MIPSEVWAQSEPHSDPLLLCDIDAVIIIGATLLHDIAMHLHPTGFLELIAPISRFRRLAWFSANQEGHAADRPWHDLWQEYIREARRFSDRVLVNTIGQESVRTGWRFQSLPDDTGQWERNHRLIVGEFIRRHHARLAHEIAIYGFPGVPAGSGEGEFPAMGSGVGHPLKRLADLIGLAARSHGTSLRVCKAYLDSSPVYAGTPRPMGTAVLYPMALLRVADYLQLDRQRAPAVLLRLRDPQSPVSVQEWQKHLAVQHVAPATSPRGVMVTVNTDVSLPLYLQLRDLLTGLQAGIDHSTAVLDETYGARIDLGLPLLNLATRRVYSNLDSQAYRDLLPFVPERTGFSADPNLLALLVAPLYGHYVGVGVRELIQNATDAVRELHAWGEAHRQRSEDLDLPSQASDVLVEFIQRTTGMWIVRVSDKGIGMRAETLQSYFLRAGASFRQSAEWSETNLDEEGKSRILRAGRFGVGAFAAFLLGPTIRVQTRHVTDRNGSGHVLEASEDSNLIVIGKKANIPIGTTIEVDLSPEAVQRLNLESNSTYDKLEDKLFWFCWDWPVVEQRVVTGSQSREIPQTYTVPVRRDGLPPDWHVIYPPGFQAVYWGFTGSSLLSCNGIRIGALDYSERDTNFDWPQEVQLPVPHIAVLDSENRFPLTLQRDEVLGWELPFADELARDVILSFIAHALVCGPVANVAKDSSGPYAKRHPLLVNRFRDRGERPGEAEPWLSQGFLRWCSTESGFVPSDPWLCSLLGVQSYIVYGRLYPSLIFWPPERACPPIPHQAGDQTNAFACWDGELSHTEAKSEAIADACRMLNELCRHGISALGHKLIGTKIVFSASGRCKLDLVDGVSAAEITPLGSQRRWYELQFGTTPHGYELSNTLKVVENSLPGTAQSSQQRMDLGVAYTALIAAASVKREPETLVAKIWNECLGPNVIPFENDAREALTSHGMRRADLRRHIEAWQKMKRTDLESTQVSLTQE